MDKIKIIFTDHSIERLEEMDINATQAREFLRDATKLKKSKRLIKHKTEKYGIDDTSFYAFGLHLFTVKFTKDKYGEEIALVITYTYMPNNNWFYRK